MDIFSSAEKMMRMDDATWARHANPWSVWTRLLTAIPFISLAVWSRVWLGWYALIPIALSVCWAWINPRAFPPPRSTDNWASKGIFGERIFLERRHIDIPEHHLTAATLLAVAGMAGAVAWVYGLVMFETCAVLVGASGIVLTKIWFVDRMVWIFDEMKFVDSRYAAWLT